MYFSCPRIRLQTFIQVSQVKRDNNIIIMWIITDDKTLYVWPDDESTEWALIWFGCSFIHLKNKNQIINIVFFPLCDPGNEPLSASSWRDLDFCTSLSGGEPSKDGGAQGRMCWKMETRNGFIRSSKVALSQHLQEKDDAPFIFPSIYPKWHLYRILRGELKQETRTPVFILRCFMFYWSRRRPDYRAEGTNTHTGDELKLIQDFWRKEK